MRAKCGFATLVALLIGIWLGFHIRTNHILFEVESGGKVNLIPTVGDVIEWRTPASKPQDAKVTLSFLGGDTPCAGPDGKPGPLPSPGFPCTIAQPPPENPNYVYHCKSSSDTCFDPGMGPVSTTGPSGNILLHDLLRSMLGFRLSGMSWSPEKPPSSGSAPTGLPTNAPIPAAAKTATTVTPYVYCSSATQVSVDPNDGANPDTAIQVSAGDTINWNYRVGYSIDGDALKSLCTTAHQPPFVPVTNPACTIVSQPPAAPGANGFPYTVTVTSPGSTCLKSKATEYIIIQ